MNDTKFLVAISFNGPNVNHPIKIFCKRALTNSFHYESEVNIKPMKANLSSLYHSRGSKYRRFTQDVKIIVFHCQVFIVGLFYSSYLVAKDMNNPETTQGWNHLLPVLLYTFFSCLP